MLKKIAVFSLFLFQIAFCQNELQFDLDFARYKYDSTSVYLEFYYSLNSKNMTVVENQSQKLIEAIVHVEIKNIASDSFFVNKDWKIQNIISGKDSLNNTESLAGVFGFPVPKGNYSLFIKAWDSNNPGLNKTIKENIEIIPHDKYFSISDIEIATNIHNGNVDPQSIFYKNTYEVIPNAQMVYSNKLPIAFYYAELYNLTDSVSSTDFTLQKLLFNSTGTNIQKNTKTIKQAKNSIVEVGTINLSKYPTDSYNLVLSLINNRTKKAFLSSKRFFLYNPGVIDSSISKNIDGSIVGSTFGILTDEECDKMFLQCKYIAAQVEIEKYESLDSLNAKRSFLANFWKNRDSDPVTLQNEFYNEYMKRIEYANTHFYYSGKEGFLSDRGRVYLIYGEPDQRDYFPNESDTKPYETWFYNNIEGGATFIFGDISSFGRYELLHSTKRGEVKDEDWKERISTK